MSSGVFRWECGKCGRPNEVEVAGRNPSSPVNCKWVPCRASKRIPVRMFGGAYAGPARRSVPDKAAKVRTPQRKPGAKVARRVVAEPEPESWQPTPEEVERFADGFRVLARRDPGVLEPTAVIPPDRAPAAQPGEPAGPGERLTVVERARQALSRRLLSAPYVDPLQPGMAQVCAACAADGIRAASGYFLAAAFAIELDDGTAALVCAAHLAVAKSLKLVVERGRPGEAPRGSVRLLAQPQPPRKGHVRKVIDRPQRLVPAGGDDGLPALWSVRTDFLPLPRRAPNPVTEVSGDYSGQLAASLTSAAVSPRNSQPRLSLPS